MEDVYSEASALADDLDTAGFAEFAEDIRESIAAGSTATEILIALRVELQSAARTLSDTSLGNRACLIATTISELLE